MQAEPALTRGLPVPLRARYVQPIARGFALAGADKGAYKASEIARGRRARCTRDADVILRAQAPFEPFEPLPEHAGRMANATLATATSLASFATLQP